MNIENQKEYMEKIKKINEGKNLKYSIFTMGCQLNEKSACPSIKPYKSNPEKNIVPTKNKIPSHPSSWML